MIIAWTGGIFRIVHFDERIDHANGTSLVVTSPREWNWFRDSKVCTFAHIVDVVIRQCDMLFSLLHVP